MPKAQRRVQAFDGHDAGVEPVWMICSMMRPEPWQN